jgi:prohibitin 2
VTLNVFALQVAQQEAQRAQFIVERAVQERQQKIVQAEGEAKAASLIGEAVNANPGYLKLRKLKAAQAIARTVSSKIQKALFASSCRASADELR